MTKFRYTIHNEKHDEVKGCVAEMVELLGQGSVLHFHDSNESVLLYNLPPGFSVTYGPAQD